MDNMTKETLNEGTKKLLEAWRKFNSFVVGIFTVLIISVFPLVFHDYYHDILVVKYVFYYGSVILMIVVMLAGAVFFFYKDKHELGGNAVKEMCSKAKLDALKKSDWAMMFFLIAVTVSTLQSEYRFESFWGNEGRYMGMFLILLYGISFFVISRCLRYSQWYLDVFLAAGIVACMIGILHFFKIDPIGFKRGLRGDDYVIFTSTIGNINTYTSYVAMVSGMGAVMFSVEKNTYRRLWYLIAAVISLFALIVGISDNAYLALLVLFGLLPLYLFRNIDGVKRYVLLLAVLFTEFQVIGTISYKFPNHVIEFQGLMNVIASFSGLTYLIIGLWGCAVCLYLIAHKLPKNHLLHSGSNIGRWVWLSVILLVCMGAAYMLYDVNIAGNIEKYGALNQYLLLNDDWGTHRGYIWRIGMEFYQKQPIHHKLFGYGPDTFGIITVKNYFEDMVRRYGEKFDSAHNEYLQYLVTIGIVGLTAYLALLATSIIEMLRTLKKRPELIAIVFAVICYGAQAAVNISVPIVAPIMLTLMMLGVAAVRSVSGNTE
ncbi:MAG: O-antigen ligase family protein [Enterocloster bolteae]|uniref:O-antigen ligase family protein n=1 Tax=Enterocloster bolteae TaxID=208479 RepID=UPI00399382D8